MDPNTVPPPDTVHPTAELRWWKGWPDWRGWRRVGIEVAAPVALLLVLPAIVVFKTMIPRFYSDGGSIAIVVIFAILFAACLLWLRRNTGRIAGHNHGG